MKKYIATLITALAVPSLLLAQAQNTAKDNDKKTEFGSPVNWKTLRISNYDVPYVIATSDGSTPISGAGGASGTVAQGSTTSGQSGMLSQGAVTTAAPTYTTGQTDPFSLDTAGNLRVSLASVPTHAISNLPATVDTNSGVKSASTLRVVLATDQPALTNKLLVTPDSVALPANQSVNVSQIAGTTTDTNSGNKSAGTQRVVLATDQPNLTTALNVKPAVRTTWATGQVTASNVAGTLVASNSTRRQCLIKNTDASITVYIGPATVTSANGMPLKAGESMPVTATSLIQVIAASGSPVVAYSDESD